MKEEFPFIPIGKMQVDILEFPLVTSCDVWYNKEQRLYVVLYPEDELRYYKPIQTPEELDLATATMIRNSQKLKPYQQITYLTLIKDGYVNEYKLKKVRG